MRKNMEKILIFAIVFVLGTGICAVRAEAASVNWHLRYVKGEPTTVNIYEWTTTVYTTGTNITMKVSNMNSNAEVYVYTDSGMSSIFSKNGNISIKTKKKLKTYAYAGFHSYGKGSANPTGTFIY